MTQHQVYQLTGSSIHQLQHMIGYVTAESESDLEHLDDNLSNVDSEYSIGTNTKMTDVLEFKGKESLKTITY